MIPTALGNIVGGGLFVGAAYWYLYLTGVGPDEIKFDLGGLDSAMEAGGPMGRSHRKSVPDTGSGSGSSSNKEEVLDGREPEVGDPNHVHSVPSSGLHMGSGLGRELNAELYAKPKSEVVGNEKV